MYVILRRFLIMRGKRRKVFLPIKIELLGRFLFVKDTSIKEKGG